VKDKTILLVEDDEDQAMLAVRALRKHGISEGTDGVVVARTGEEALDHLLGTAARDAGRAGRGTPAFVLLDKNLPGTDGLGVLRRMRADGRTRLVPVVLFSSSGEPEEVAEGYRLGANPYVTKPADYGRFSEALGCLGRYWLDLNELPG
jgi:two-component system response regulator